MDNDNSKEGKKEPGEFTQLFSAFIPPAAPEAKPDEKLKAEPPAHYEPQRPARTIRIPLVEDPQKVGEFTRVFSALQQAPVVTPPAGPRQTPPAPPPQAPPQATPPPGPGDFTRVFASPAEPLVAPVKPEPQRPSSGLDQAGTFRAFPAQFVNTPSVQDVPAPLAAPTPASAQASEAEFTRLFNSPLAAAEAKVNWAEIENRPAPLPGPKAPGNFTQMFGRPDIGSAAHAEGAASLPQAAKPEVPMSSFTSVFSPPKMEITEPKIDTPAVAAAAPRAVAAEPKQAAPAAKAQGPSIVILGVVLLVILIIAAAALYFFVIRK